MINDDAMRMLGTRDGIAHALLAVRAEISALDVRRANPRHTRKNAERERVLAPLRRLERRLSEMVDSTRDAYERMTHRVPADGEAAIRNMALAGQTVQAVRLYRNLTGARLKDAVDHIRRIQSGSDNQSA